MSSRTPTVEEQRDNLSIGIYLAASPHGVGLEQILEVALGYDPQNPTRPHDHYERRFRNAQAVGRDRFKDRLPGYFTFNAVHFGGLILYKAYWYVWVNPQTGNAQVVPIFAGDLAPMARTRDKDLSTRKATARSIRTASNIEEQRQAIERGDFYTLHQIHAQMADDDTLGEVLTGLHGIPYADLAKILPQLPYGTFGSMTLSFQKTASRIQNLERRLRQEQARISRELMSWVMLQTGLPSNVQQLALQDAAERLRHLYQE